MKNIAKYLAEFAGTFLLTAVVFLSIAGNFPVSTPVLAGFLVVIFVYVIGTISGCHINPAVTLGLLTRGKIRWQDAIVYLAVQMFGAVLAMYFAESLGASIRVASIVGENVFVAEMMGAAVFGMGIMAVVRNKVDEDLNGFVIGGALFLGIAFAALIGSAGVLNPAIAIALGLTNWQYLLSSIVGMILGMAFYDFLIGEKLANLKITFAGPEEK